MKRYYGPLAAAVFALAALSLKPWAMNFVLNDDWAYSLPVQTLHERGGLILTDWSPHTQVLQILWGWLWTLPFGFSLGTLKLSVIFIATAGIWLFHLLLRETGADDWCSAAAALCLAFNPLFFLLSESFMTDVPYLVLVIASTLAFLKWRNGKMPLQICSLGCAGAVLIHQTGLLLPAAFSLMPGPGERPGVKQLLYLWLPALAVFGCWSLWLHGGTHVPAVMNAIGLELCNFYSDPSVAFSAIIMRLAQTALYLGFFAAPLSAALLFDADFRRELAENYVLAAVCLLGYLGLSFSTGGPTAIGNIINSTGLGNIAILDGQKTAGIFGLAFFWPAIAAISTISALILAVSLSKYRNVRIQPLLAVFGMQFAAPMCMSNFFDRYLIYLLPLLLAAAAVRLHNCKTVAKVLPWAIALMGIFTWAGTSDYLSWNRAKWQLAYSAQKYGIKPEEVTAGFDYDGWHNYERNADKVIHDKTANEWSWRAFSTTKAAVTFSIPSQKNGDLLEKLNYYTPISPFRRGTLYLVKVTQEERKSMTN